MADKKQVLKITKPDKSVHFGEVSTKSKLQFQNTLKKPEERLHLEVVEMTEKEIAAHPGFDSSFVPVGKSGNTSAELAELKKKLASETGEKEDLQKQIADLEAKVLNPPTVSAAQLVVMIDVAMSAQEVDELVGEDTRVSVTKAAVKRKAELEKL